MSESKKRKIGVVVSDKMEQTVVVAVEQNHRHPIYQKIVKSSSRILADNPNNQWHEGDAVVIEEMRPMSKHKSWRVVAGEHGLADGDLNIVEPEVMTPTKETV